MALPPAGKHVIIVGGISVNDPGGHDLYPYNFINPAARRAKDYKSDVVVLIFAPPYETRAMEQGKEHSTVTMSYRDTCLLGVWDAKDCPAIFKSKEANARHFLEVMQGAGKRDGYPVIELRSAADLTAQLIAIRPIATVDYFGHANDKALFLQYSTGISPGAAEVMWTAADAAKVPVANFQGAAQFNSFGCNNGDPKGLGEQLRDLWGINVAGSLGRTDYAPIGQGATVPSTAGGYYLYPKAKGAAPTKLPAAP
jgi:hypothetical protein